MVKHYLKRRYLLMQLVLISSNKDVTYRYCREVITLNAHSK